MVTNVKIRWEGTTLIVENNDGEEMRFENAYVKDPRYDYVEPEKPMMEPVPVAEVEAILDRCTFKLKNDD